ncbi:AAA family ATPase [Halococcus sp. PRR34]|uniref:AAA family ATPase n=1 Tax=Halococcus sp. PRR34 TaxID=3020830 RepID=UPI00235FD2DC|nr:AAA family ATPase [Halococcus sp. PRR34]
MITSRLQQDLPLYNQWWQSDDPPGSEDSPYRESRRSDYENHIDAVRNRRFYALVGADGSGKSSTLYQIVHDFIVRDDIDPDQIVYVPVENPLYALESDQFVLDVYEWYTSYVHRSPSDDERIYFLFDDIYQITDWPEQVKTLLDQSESIHVAVTLPTDVPALEKFERSLFETRSILLPPKFYDFARIDSDVPGLAKKDHIYPIRKGLADQRSVDFATLVDECLTLQDQLSTEYENLPSVVDDYLFNSGLRDKTGHGLSTIKQRLQLALYKDVQQFYSIEDPSDLFTLCVLVAQEPVREYQFSQLVDQLETDRRTVRKYLDILQEFLILSPSYKWGYERHRTLRMYLRDPRYVSALNLLSDTDARPVTNEHRRNLIHSVVYDHLRRLAFYLNDDTDVGIPVRYWDEANESVEYVLNVNGSPFPVALTTRRGEEAATEAVFDCLEDTEAAQGVVAGEDIQQPYAGDDRVVRLPLWMLLYIC